MNIPKKHHFKMVLNYDFTKYIPEVKVREYLSETEKNKLTRERNLKRIYFNKLDLDITPEELRAVIAPYGEIELFYLKDTSNDDFVFDKKYGYVVFKTKAEA